MAKRPIVGYVRVINPGAKVDFTGMIVPAVVLEQKTAEVKVGRRYWSIHIDDYEPLDNVETLLYLNQRRQHNGKK